MLTIIVIVDLLCHILYNDIYYYIVVMLGNIYFIICSKSPFCHSTMYNILICSNCHLIYILYKIYIMKNVGHGWKTLKQFFLFVLFYTKKKK